MSIKLLIMRGNLMDISFGEVGKEVGKWTSGQVDKWAKGTPLLQAEGENDRQGRLSYGGGYGAPFYRAPGLFQQT